MASTRGFQRHEVALIAAAAALVFTRVLAFSLTTIGFTEYARALAPAGWDPQSVSMAAGIAFGAYGFTMAFAQLGSGILADRIGRRVVLVGGSVVFVAGAALCALTDSLPMLIAGRLLQGLGGVSSVALAAVGETVPDSRRTTAMALVGIPAGIAVFLGFMIGPALAGLLGFTGLFWVTAGLGVASGLPFLLRALPAPLTGLAVAARSLSLPVLALGICGFTANFATMVVMFDFQADVMPRLGRPALTAILLCALVAVGVLSRVVDRSRAPFVVLGASIAVLAVAGAAFRLGMPFATHLAFVALAGGLFFSAHALLSAALPSQVSRLAGRSGGRGHGIQMVIAYLGTAAGGLVAGAAADRLGFAFAMLGVLAGLAAGLLLFSVLTQGSRRTLVAAAQP